jgi:putative MATE family efflux protein
MLPAVNSRLLKSPGILRPMLSLALPVLLEQTLNLSVSYTDWWLTGHFLRTADHLAAMGLMGYVMWLLPNLFAAVAIGVTAIVARHVGAGRYKLARLATNQAFVAGAGLALLVTTIAVLCTGPFVQVMQLEPRAAGLASEYLSIVLLAIPAIMVEELGVAALRGAGDTVSGLFAKVVVNVVNIAISSALVTGFGVFQPLGWSGLAIGTATGHIVGAAIIAALLLAGRANLDVRLGWMRPRAHMIGRLLRIGIPGGLDIAVILFCHFVYLAIVNKLGTTAAAAHGLGVQIEALSYLPGSAFQVAAATMAGQYLGARDPHRAVRGVLMAAAVGGGLMCLAGLAFAFAGWPLTTFFMGSGDVAIQGVTVDLLKVVAISEPFLAATMILTGALRGAGDTRWPLLFSLIGFVGVRLPLAVILAYDEIPLPLVDITLPGFGYGVIGAWYAMVADIFVRSLLVTLRFLQGGWLATRV